MALWRKSAGKRLWVPPSDVSAESHSTSAFRSKAFTLVSLGFIIAFANSLLNLYRARHAHGTSAPTSGQNNTSLIPSLSPYQQALFPPAQTSGPWARAVSPGFYPLPVSLAAPPSPSKVHTRWKKDE